MLMCAYFLRVGAASILPHSIRAFKSVRFIEYYLHWPWPIGKVADERLPLAVRQGTGRRFVSLKRCCVDPFAGEAILAAAPTLPRLMSVGMLRFIASLYFHMKSQTIPVEERFKRIKLHASSSSGAVVNASTMASNHTLAEGKSLWRQAMDLQGHRTPRTRVKGARGSVGAPTPKRKAVYKKRNAPRMPSVWTLFVGQFKLTLPRGENECARDYNRRLRREASRAYKSADEASLPQPTDADRRRLRERKRQHCMVGAGPALEPEQKPVGPWGLGDVAHPYSLQRLRPRAQQVAFVEGSHQKWCASYGQKLSTSRRDGFPMDPQRRQPCGERYGAGVCESDLSGTQLAEFNTHVEVLNSIALASDFESRENGIALLVSATPPGPNAVKVEHVFLMMWPSGNPVFQVYVGCVYADGFVTIKDTVHGFNEIANLEHREEGTPGNPPRVPPPRESKHEPEHMRV